VTEHEDTTRRQRNEEIISEYLVQTFSQRPEVSPLPQHGGLHFRVKGVQASSVWFSDAFLEDTEPNQLADRLREWDIAARMRGLGRNNVLKVTNDGVAER
jgi:hypothetical protein